ncbi:MAG: hypothetical protein RLZZ383_2359 [Pseudomonadota bacterium]|jgi:hypothetical protein
MRWVLGLVLKVASASQDVDAEAWRTHQDAAARAAEAERRAEPEAALVACAEAIDLLPQGPRSMWCSERIAFLEARRDPDGGFRGWTALERTRRSFADRATQRAEILSLVAGEGVGERARREAFLWLADDALLRLADPDEAARWSGPLASTPDLPEEERRRYRVLHARVLAARGQWEEAAAVEADVLVAPGGRRLSPVETAARDAWRALATRGAAAWTFGFAVVSVLRGFRGRPAALGPGGWPLVVGWASAAATALSWEASNDALFVSVGGGLAAVHALAWLGGSGRGGPGWYRFGAVIAAPAVVVIALAWHQRFEEIGW